MDMLTFIVNIIGAIVWPIVVAMVVWLIRIPLANRIDSLKSIDIEFMDFKMKTELKLKEVDADLKVAEKSGNKEDIKLVQGKIDAMLKQLDSTVYQRLILDSYDAGKKNGNFID